MASFLQLTVFRSTPIYWGFVLPAFSSLLHRRLEKGRLVTVDGALAFCGD